MPPYIAYRRGENYDNELKLQDSWRLPPLIEKLYVPNFSNCNLYCTNYLYWCGSQLKINNEVHK